MVIDTSALMAILLDDPLARVPPKRSTPAPARLVWGPLVLGDPVVLDPPRGGRGVRT